VGYLRILTKEILDEGLNINLSAEGTLGWSSWGRVDANTFDYLAGGLLTNDIALISGTTKGRTGGDAVIGPFVQWSGQSAVPSGLIFTGGNGKGCTLSIPATNETRRALLLIGTYGGETRLDAALSDSSATAQFITIKENYGSKMALVCIDFEAGDNSSRTLNLTLAANDGSAIPILLAVLLQGGLIQSDFRLRNDDGSEAAATWAAGQGSNASFPVGKNFRVRFELTAAGDRPQDSLIEVTALDGSPDSSLIPVSVAASDYETPTVVAQVVKPFSGPEANPTGVGPTITFSKSTDLDPLGLQVGDAVHVLVAYRGTTETITVSQAGGQTWTTTQHNNTSASLRVLDAVAIFDGTWDNDLIFTVTSGTNAMEAVLKVIRNVDTSTPRHVAMVKADFTAPGSSPFGVSINNTSPGFATSIANALVDAAWVINDNNDWALATAGWLPLARSSGNKNSSTTGLAIFQARKLMRTAGNPGDVQANQSVGSGADPGMTLISAWKPKARANKMILADSPFITDGVATTQQLV